MLKRSLTKSTCKSVSSHSLPENIFFLSMTGRRNAEAYHGDVSLPKDFSIGQKVDKRMNDRHFLFGCSDVSLLGSKVCIWPGARMTLPPSSCLHTGVRCTQGSAWTSSRVARFFGSISSIWPMICLVSRGRRRNRRHGPLMTGEGLIWDTESEDWLGLFRVAGSWDLA